jgi:hypothetical protein
VFVLLLCAACMPPYAPELQQWRGVQGVWRANAVDGRASITLVCGHWQGEYAYDAGHKCCLANAAAVEDDLWHAFTGEFMHNCSWPRLHMSGMPWPILHAVLA